MRISGVRGSEPPEKLKVCVNELGGYRNQAELVLVGLDIEEKADWVRTQVTDALSADPPAAVEWSLARTDHEDADTEEARRVGFGCPCATRTRTVSARPSPHRWSSWPWRPIPASR